MAINGTKESTGLATCMLTGELIQKGEQVLVVQVSRVQEKQISLSGLLLGLKLLGQQKD